MSGPGARAAARLSDAERADPAARPLARRLGRAAGRRRRRLRRGCWSRRWRGARTSRSRSIGLGAPAALLLLREQSTISPARLLVAVVRWRARPRCSIAPTSERPVAPRRGPARHARARARARAIADVERAAVARADARGGGGRDARADARRRRAGRGGRARRAAGHHRRRATCGCSSACSRCSRCAAAASTATRSATGSPRSPPAFPAGQSLQVVVEAEPLDADAALARDWREIDAAAARRRARGDARARRGDAPARLRARADVRRSAPAVAGGRSLRWTVATRWRPRRASWRPRARARAARARAHADAARARARRRRLAALHRHDRRRARRRRLRARSARRRRGARRARARRYARQRPPRREPFAALPQVLDTTDAGCRARAPPRAARGASATARELHVGRDWLTHRAAGELEAVLHLSGAPADTSVWWLLGLMEVPPPWRLVGARHRDRPGAPAPPQRLRHKRLWADLRRRERDGKLIAEEAYEQEREAAELDAELRLTGASGIYDVSPLPRHPPPRRRARSELADAARARSRATSSPTPTRACTAAASWSRTRGSRRSRSASTGSARRGASRSATSATACRC